MSLMLCQQRTQHLQLNLQKSSMVGRRERQDVEMAIAAALLAICPWRPSTFLP